MASVTMNSGRFSLRVTYEANQSIETNASVVRITKVELRSDWYDGESFYLAGSITAQGETALELTYSSSEKCRVWLGDGYSGGGERWTGWHSRPVSVYHREDGTQELRLAADIALYSLNGTKEAQFSSSGSRSLGAIPRTSPILAEGVTLGRPMHISLNRTNHFRSTLTWYCGSQSGTIAEDTLESEFTWTPPEALAWQATESAEAEVTLFLVSYSGTAAVGSRMLTVKCPVPETMVPSVSTVAEDALGYAARFGGYVQSKSRLRIRSTAAGVCGSSIRGITVEFDGMTAQGEDVTFVPVNAGTLPFKVTAVDSRGRTAVRTVTVNIQPYSPPRVEIQSLDRCNDQGTLQRDGGYAKVEFSVSITSLGGRNTAHYVLRRSLRGRGQPSELPMTALENRLESGRAEFVFPVDVDQDYECKVLLEDTFEQVQSAPAALSVAFALLDFHRGSRAVGIGQRAGTGNMVSVGLDMKLYGHRITDLGDPEDGRDAVPVEWLAALYPVGAVYLSAVDFCVPQVLFGGTWQRIEDRFLLAAGPVHGAGTTGGAETHTLTEAELPAHSHSYDLAEDWLASPGTEEVQNFARRDVLNLSFRTGTTGSNQPHNNMPPYLAVYMWVRVG